MYHTMSLSKSRVHNSTINNLIRVCDLYAHAQSIRLLWCKFQTIILKLLEELQKHKLYYKV